MSLFNEDTPIEKYKLGGKTVYVKRDDMYGNHPAPPLGKLRGLRVILKKAYKNGDRLIGCWDTRVSKLGQGLAAACKNFDDMKALVSYPRKNGCPIPMPIKIAEGLGAEIYPIRGNHVSICYAQVSKYVKNRGGIMIPFGLECKEAVGEISKVAKSLPVKHYKNGTIVLCCGSGVTLAGILLGLVANPWKIVGISSGRSIAKITQCLKRYVSAIPPYLKLCEAIIPYSQVPNVECPFPTHPNYDLKAWAHLINSINQYREPILFWNIGA